MKATTKPATTNPVAAKTVGVIAHIDNPGFGTIRHMARTAEEAGADWLGVADAFWWRDTWLLLAEAARATKRLRGANRQAFPPVDLGSHPAPRAGLRGATEKSSDLCGAQQPCRASPVVGCPGAERQPDP